MSAADAASAGGGTERVQPGGAIQEVDRRYARALFSTLSGNEPIMAAQRSMAQLGACLDAHEPLRRALASPLHALEVKASLLGALCEKLDGPVAVCSFVRFVGIKGRADRIHAIARAFALLVAAHRGMSRIEVYTARAVSDARRASLTSAIARLCGDGVAVDMRIDPALIGGVRMRMGSRLVDASIRGRIDRLALNLRGH